MVRARTCRLELNQIWRKFRNDPGSDRQGHEIGTMQYARCPRLAVDSAAPVCGVSYRSGFGFGADSVKEITVPHLRHVKLSKRGLFASDLLPSIATPQSGQC